MTLVMALPFAMVSPEMTTVAAELTKKMLPTVAELFPETVTMLAPSPWMVSRPFRAGSGVSRVMVFCAVVLVDLNTAGLKVMLPVPAALAAVMASRRVQLVSRAVGGRAGCVVGGVVTTKPGAPFTWMPV